MNDSVPSPPPIPAGHSWLPNTPIFPLACPVCHRALELGSDQCSGCRQTFTSCEDWFDLAVSLDRINEATRAAYQVYSRFHAPLALLAYWIVWRGRLRRHVAFFRELLNHGRVIVDIATGDGWLTRLALFGSRRKRAESVLALDISGSMLVRASRRLPQDRSLLVRGDVTQLPFADRSIRMISCFGGLNSFPSGAKALKEIARVLSKDGRMRGSVFLVPRARWRRKWARRWIATGYHTEQVDEFKFRSWVHASELKILHSERNGDVLLFELGHR